MAARDRIIAAREAKRQSYADHGWWLLLVDGKPLPEHTLGYGNCKGLPLPTFEVER